MKKTLIIILFLNAFTAIKAQNYYFKHYKVEDGLTHNSILTIQQDKHGFLWFGTKDGLNRFDGYNFKAFVKNDNDPKSIGSNFIKKLHEYNGYLWVGTDKGLYRYNENLENFDHINTKANLLISDITNDDIGNLWFISGSEIHKYNADSDKLTSFPVNDYFAASAIVKLSNGTIWASSTTGKIYRYIPDNNSFDNFNVIRKNKQSQLLIHKLFDAGNGNIFIGTRSNGILTFDIQQKIFKNLFPKTLSALFIRDIIKKDENEFWIASESGIHIFNVLNKSLINLKKSYNDPYSLSDNAIHSLNLDKEGGVWVGTYFGGINYYPKQNKVFKKYFPKVNENSLSGNAVREILEDDYGNLWIGTEDSGLNMLNQTSEKFNKYDLKTNNIDLFHDNIHGLLPIKDKLWIGTFEHGLYILDIKTKRLVKHYKASSKPNTLTSNFIYSIYKNKDGQIFIMTPVGINLYDPVNDNFSIFNNFPKHFFYTSMLEDNNGVLWAGTYRDGLFYYNPNTNEKNSFKHIVNNKNSLSSNRVSSIFEDSQNNLWITTDCGLNKFNHKTKTFKRYTTSEGFPSNVIYSILEDKSGNLWISTSKGLVNFNPSSEKTKTFTNANGLLNDQFNYNSAFKKADGTMFFGSVNGMISFNPESFLESNYIPPIFITALQVNNTKVVIRKDSLLPKSVTFINEVTLKPNQSSFSLDFAALSYAAPEEIEYSYKMKGLDDKWIHLKRNRKVYFTELSPGNYTFQIRALKNNEIWSKKATTLDIKVLPTFWGSTIARFFYLLVGASLFLLGLRYYHTQTKQKNDIRIRQLNNRKEKEIYQAKIEFFTNIAHEIRTPLTLIKSPLEKLIKTFGDHPKLKDNLWVMEKNTQRLLDLTNQLLDFRKTEMESISLSFVETNMSELLRNIFSRFSQAIKNKNLNFDLNLPDNDVYATIDPEAATKILSNLFNNAIKYCENKCVASLKIISDLKEEFIEVVIQNDGELISTELKDKIFEPFFRIDEGGNQSGTGIGLSLAYTLTELHNGNLKLDINNKSMNTFVLRFPVHQEKEFKLFDEKNQVLETIDDNNFETLVDFNKANILLVEDNTDLLNFITKDLNEKYTVLRAENGAKALDILKQKSVQLIVSDVMMPVMDGFELCHKLKTNLEYSHIPIILLTAKTALNAKIEGLESGADVYIEKPFSMEYLEVQISSLIEKRKSIMDYYSSSPFAHLKSIAHSSTDEAFINKIDKVIYNNLSDSNLSVDTLAEIMNMSRSTLYRKIKEISNLSPNELINISRLKRAAELLKNDTYKIYEIADIVGYNSISSFGRNFQKQFNMTPSEYMNSSDF